MFTDLVTAEFAATEKRRADSLPRTAVVRFVVNASESVLRWSLEQQPASPAQQANMISLRLMLGALAGAACPNARTRL